MKKLLGKNDIEDGLKRLDTLTQEESWMASAQLVQARHSTENRVRVMVDKELDAKDNVVSVNSRRRGVRSREATTDDTFATFIIGVQPLQSVIRDVLTMMVVDGNEAKAAVQQIASDEPQGKCLSSIPPSSIAGASCVLAAIQPRGDLHNWLSPPDPTKNHNLASKARHEGTARWFLDDSTFKQWKSTMSPSSLLWIYGKRGSIFLPSRFNCSRSPI